MSGVLKIAGKVGAVLLASFCIGYAEYRLKGGEPIHKLYREVRKGQLAAAPAGPAKAENPIQGDGKVE